MPERCGRSRVDSRIAMEQMMSFAVTDLHAGKQPAGGQAGMDPGGEE